MRSSDRSAHRVHRNTCRVKRGTRTLYTVGHSTRTADELVEILDTYAVTRLVDIRSFPRSRTNPQFNLDVLPDTLCAAKISYVHLAALGGRRGKSKSIETGVNTGWERQPFHNYADYAETEPFQKGLDELLAMTVKETCAIMCAEVLWWRCHRRIVVDHVLARGVPVFHISTRERAAPAVMTPFAVVNKAGRIAYPAHAAMDTASRAITRRRDASPKRRAPAPRGRRSPA